MRRFFSSLFCFILIFSSVQAEESEKTRILRERLERERSEVDYDMKVAEQEYDVTLLTAFNTLIKYKKLIFLEKSTRTMRSSCLVFDDKCRRLYDMSLVYLKGEMKKTKAQLDENERQLDEAVGRQNSLKEKLELLKKGVAVEFKNVSIKPVIPELKSNFSCMQRRNWNPRRGVFVKADSAEKIPFDTVVSDVVALEKGFVISMNYGEYKLYYAYAGRPLVQPGERVVSGTQIFSGSEGNLNAPGHVIIFVTKNGNFVNPGFMCR